MKKNYIYPPVPTSKSRYNWYEVRKMDRFAFRIGKKIIKYNERVEQCRASSDAVTPSKLIAQLGELGPAEFNSSSIYDKITRFGNELVYKSWNERKKNRKY